MCIWHSTAHRGASVMVAACHHPKLPLSAMREKRLDSYDADATASVDVADARLPVASTPHQHIGGTVDSSCGPILNGYARVHANYDFPIETALLVCELNRVSTRLFQNYIVLCICPVCVCVLCVCLCKRNWRSPRKWASCAE